MRNFFKATTNGSYEYQYQNVKMAIKPLIVMYRLEEASNHGQVWKNFYRMLLQELPEQNHKALLFMPVCLSANSLINLKGHEKI